MNISMYTVDSFKLKLKNPGVFLRENFQMAHFFLHFPLCIFDVITYSYEAFFITTLFKHNAKRHLLNDEKKQLKEYFL